MKKIWYWLIGIVLAVVIIGNLLPDDSFDSSGLTGSVIEDSQKYSNKERENYLGRGKKIMIPMRKCLKIY